MTRRRKTLLVVLALVVLAAGGVAWYRQATAVGRQVNALLDEVRGEERGLVERWGIKLGLMKDRRTGRDWPEVAGDLAKLGPSAVPELIRALRDSDYRVRYVAACALRDLGDARAVEPLITALKDESEFVRYLAAWALGKLGDSRAVEPLIAALKDEDVKVRHRAAWQLGELGDARAVEPLIAALKDEDEVVRGVAAEALGKLGDARAVKPLKELLGDEHPVVRAAAAKALKRLRGQGGRVPCPRAVCMGMCDAGAVGCGAQRSNHAACPARRLPTGSRGECRSCGRRRGSRPR